MRRDGGSVLPAHANTGDPNGPFEAGPLIRPHRADIHDGSEHNTLQSEAGYIDARPHVRQIDETLLQLSDALGMSASLRSRPNPRTAAFVSAACSTRSPSTICHLPSTSMIFMAHASSSA